MGYDNIETEFLVNGFRYGFSIGYTGEIENIVSKNLKSANDLPDVISKKLEKEICLGRIMGPFTEKPLPVLHCSPLGLVNKKTEGEYRMIHHLSYPEGKSVNDGIPEEESFVQYSSVEDAIQYIKECGKGSYCCKTDISNAFRIINLHASQFKYFGFTWQGNWYFDTCLQMGCSSSCRIFERFSTAVQWIAQEKLGIKFMTHVLDDFLIVDKSATECRKKLETFLTVCADIGIPMAKDKTFGPDKIMTFLGYELDTEMMEARLPIDKIRKCKDAIEEILPCKKITLKDMQSVIGLLNFACNVVLPGRAFLRRLINTTVGITKSYYRIRLNKEVKADLHTWLAFLDQFNGRSVFLPDRWVDSNELKLYTDASGSIGYGAVLGGHWFYGTWDVNWKKCNITLLEFYPIVLALKVWSHILKNKCIYFYTDNYALVHIINKQSSKDKCIMYLVRELVLICLQSNILFQARHLSTKENILCDCLSRLKVQQFHQLAPWMDKEPMLIPQLPALPP